MPCKIDYSCWSFYNFSDIVDFAKQGFKEVSIMLEGTFSLYHNVEFDKVPYFKERHNEKKMNNFFLFIPKIGFFKIHN